MKKYAIFFPQFHQVKVNDSAWGFGFTDWSLVACANAFDLWKRRAPASGFYDLADPAQVSKKLSKAADSGLDGFGIYHYRFDDGPELNAVEQHLLHIDLPNNFDYFFIWANESWSKRWAGKDTEVLKHVSSNPSQQDIREHVRYLAPYFASDSYTKIDNRPVFVIYRAEFFQNPSLTLAEYRREFALVGLNPLIGYFVKSVSDVEYSSIFDFCYLFEPRLFFNFYGLRSKPIISRVFRKLVHFIPYAKVEFLSKLVGGLLNRGSRVYSFESFLNYFTSEDRSEFIKSISCPVQNVLTCGWNNSPRYRENFTELETPTNEVFSKSLNYAVNELKCSEDLPLLCNAWNEWSEGAAIEPCYYLGDDFLKIYVGQSK